MNLSKTIALLAVLSNGMPALAADDPFSGSAPLICAVTKTITCSETESCTEGLAEQVNLPRFVTIDFSNQLVSAAWPADNRKTSKIVSAINVSERLILQGVDADMAWSANIDKETGRIVVSHAGGNVGFLIFGACMPK